MSENNHQYSLGPSSASQRSETNNNGLTPLERTAAASLSLVLKLMLETLNKLISSNNNSSVVENPSSMLSLEQPWAKDRDQEILLASSYAEQNRVETDRQAQLSSLLMTFLMQGNSTQPAVLSNLLPPPALPAFALFPQRSPESNLQNGVSDSVLLDFLQAHHLLHVPQPQQQQNSSKFQGLPPALSQFLEANINPLNDAGWTLPVTAADYPDSAPCTAIDALINGLRRSHSSDLSGPSQSTSVGNDSRTENCISSSIVQLLNPLASVQPTAYVAPSNANGLCPQLADIVSQMFALPVRQPSTYDEFPENQPSFSHDHKATTESGNGRELPVEEVPSSVAAARTTDGIIPMASIWSGSHIDDTLEGLVVDESRESFPQKLFRLLSEAEQEGNTHIISFTPSGKAFKIHMPDAFMNEIAPRYFRNTRLKSFKRQLNLYGFKSVSCTPEGRCSFSHEFFQRGQPKLLRQITREYNSKSNAATSGRK